MNSALHITLLLSLLISATASSSLQQGATSRNNWKDAILERLDNQDYTTTAPLIGVLTQPHYHKHHQDSQTISGPLVSWVESAGGRVVPISYNAPWDDIERIFKSINGVVLPGGSGELWYGHPFFDTAARLVQLAKDVNDKGNTIFPLFGVCLGFETLHIILANQTREDLLVPSKGQESVANTLELTDEADSSLFFSRWTEAVMDEVGDEKLQPTFNAHEWAVPLNAYDDNKALRDQLNILSTSRDT
jgi:gamma-glutamyl hydrolase